MNPRANIVFLVQRIGPYHHARLLAWAAVSASPIVAIEFRANDTVYAWAPVLDEGNYRRIRTHSRRELCQALDQSAPCALVCVGYFDPEIHQAVAWAMRRNVRLVTCSDSTFYDEPRRWMKEVFKRQVVAAFDTALVAGTKAHEYLAGLGLSSGRCFFPWDVVDNAYFVRGAAASRLHAAELRSRYKLPVRYFLCVARFVVKKNLHRLIVAYARYVAAAGENAWSLVLSGSGPLEGSLRMAVCQQGLEAKVHFPGFVQYSDLPAYYGLADAFVLPSVAEQWGLVVNEAMAAGLPVLVSTGCGCAPDLIREGENGLTFAPENTIVLAERMAEIANRSDADRAAMGRRSQENVAVFSPDAFALGIQAAIACALVFPRRLSPVTRLSVNSLARRHP